MPYFPNTGSRSRPGLQYAAVAAMVLTAMVSSAVAVSAFEERAVRRERRAVVVRPMANRRGRPRKFARPARAVTLTLPEDVIAALKTIDPDISRAIVRTIEPLMPTCARPPAELTAFGKRSFIVVTPSRELAERTGVELLPLGDGRALLAFDDRLSVAQFELRLRDALTDDELDGDDRATFESIVKILGDTRQNGGPGIHERSIIVLETALRA